MVDGVKLKQSYCRAQSKLMGEWEVRAVWKGGGKEPEPEVNYNSQEAPGALGRK